MAKLVVTRTNQWTNRFRSIDIYMDNKKIGSVSNNESKTFEVPAGEYSFFAQADWVATEPVKLSFKDTESRQLQLGSPMQMGPIKVIAMVLIFVLIFAGAWTGNPLLFLLAIGIGVVAQLLQFLISGEKPALYYLLIARKEYFYLKEV